MLSIDINPQQNKIKMFRNFMFGILIVYLKTIITIKKHSYNDTESESHNLVSVRPIIIYRHLYGYKNDDLNMKLI